MKRPDLEHIIRAAGTIADVDDGENTRFVRGWCLEVHDLAISKYVAGREKDLEFTHALAAHGMVRRDVLEQRLAETALEARLRSLAAARIERDFAS